ncbi:hypothetical protein [Pseudomonas sp. TE3786]
MLAKELGSSKIRVDTLNPGPISIREHATHDGLCDEPGANRTHTLRPDGNT